jgi:predicted DNA-binding transcriptional regulator AlpA
MRNTGLAAGSASATEQTLDSVPYRLLSRSDLRTIGLRASNPTLLEWEAAGRFPRRVRVGSRVYWLASEVEDYIAQRTPIASDQSAVLAVLWTIQCA